MWIKTFTNLFNEEYRPARYCVLKHLLIYLTKNIDQQDTVY